MDAITPTAVALKNSPGAIERSKSSSAERISPAGVTNRRATFLRATAVGVMASMISTLLHNSCRHSGARALARTRNLEIPGLRQEAHPGMTILVRRGGLDDELRGVGLRQIV